MTMRSIRGILLLLILSSLVGGCKESGPIKIGFVGGLSGKAADLGVAGRNGVQLALEQCNAAGGIGGRPLELVAKDDGQDPEISRRVISELIDQKVEVVVGPMTSSVAMAMVPLVNGSGTILISPTVTTTELSGKDDNFLRVISVTTDYSSKSARHHYRKGIRSVAAIYDSNNLSYTKSWLEGFRKEFEGLGGRIVMARSFPSTKDTVFQSLAKELVAAGADAVLIVTNAVDSATLCLQLRKLDPGLPIIMAEWGSTERFVELAGAASEGVNVAQFFDRSDRSSRFLDFVNAYRARFERYPGFAGSAGYDAALVAIEAYRARKGKESLKEVILRKRVFQGVQQPLTIDRFGDADRKTFMTLVRNGQYVTVE